MSHLLRPQEYYYLYSPIWSDPAHMLKFAILGLCAEGHLEAFYKEIYINPNSKYPRPRIFIKRGRNPFSAKGSASAEKLLLSLIGDREMRLFEFKNALLMQLEGNIKNFKYDYVYHDIRKKNLLHHQWILNSAGRQQRRETGKLISQIEDNIDEWMNDKPRLYTQAKKLGDNIIFLEDFVLAKMKIKLINLDELYNLFNPEPGRGSDNYYDD